APTERQLVPALVLGGLICLGVLYPIRVGEKIKVGVGMPAMFAAALLLPPWLAAVTTGLGAGLAFLLRPRGSTPSALFNLAVLMLTTLLADWIATVFHVEPLSEATFSLMVTVGAVAAAATLVLTNTLLVAISTDLQLGRRPLSTYCANQRVKLPMHVALLVAGGATALVGTRQPWLMLLAVAPMVGAAVAYRLLDDRESGRAEPAAAPILIK
ncbi:MAG: hypothetical protein NZ518_06195, partial [Dehalococcoidia bacterium]|nr:hypothetical protein [Dehalococcoidia bacterium]